MFYLAATVVIASLAAHETPVHLGFMALLFCWMVHTKEPLQYFAFIGISMVLIFIIQDVRMDQNPPSVELYNGELIFQSGYKLDGGNLRGFAELQDGTRVYARYRIGSEEEQKALEQALPGVSLVVGGTFEAPSPPSHKFSFDMQRYVKNNGASAVLKIDRIQKVKPLQTLMTRLEERRKKLKKHIRETFPKSLATEAEALLIGEQENMGPEERQIYQTLGITHLFAISGLHVAILTGLLYFLLIRMHVRKETVLVLLLMALPLYAVLAGGAPSVLRAVSMVCLILAGRLMKLRLAVADVLFVSFIFFILWDPYRMYDIGFQLSYGATFGIIYSAKFLQTAESAAIQGFLITAISQLTLYPLLLYHFYEVSLSAFLVNSLFVPLYTVAILPMNLILLFLTFIYLPLAELIFALYTPVRGLLGTFMETLALVPFQLWNPGKPSKWLVFVLMGSVALFYVRAEKSFRWRQLNIVLVPALLFTLLPYVDSSLKVTFLDVGQGDSAVIQLPYRRGVYVIDTGGLLRFGREGFQEPSRPYEVGRQVVVPYLKGSGISRVDVLVLSHADADHVEGADEVFELLEIERVHISPGSEAEAIMQELVPYAAEAALTLPVRGDFWEAEDARFSYLSPSDRIYEGNNDSLVLLLESGNFNVLFTGDLEADGERELIDVYGDGLKETTILKVGHHGSKSSSTEEFLSAVSPGLSIFSTGKDNRYGHPAQEVVERFKKLNLSTLNTADNGTIEVIVKKGKVEVAPMR